MKKELNNKNKKILKINTPLYNQKPKLYAGEVFYSIFQTISKNLKKDKKSDYKNSFKPPLKHNYSYNISLKLMKTATICLMSFSIYFNSVELYLASQNKIQNLTPDFDVGNTIEDDTGENDFEVDDNGQINTDVSTDEEKEEILNKLYNLILRDCKNFGINISSIKTLLSIDQIQMKDEVVSQTFDNYLISIKFQGNNDKIYDMQFFADTTFEFAKENMSSLDKIGNVVEFLNNPNKSALFGYSYMNNYRTEMKSLVEENLKQKIDYVGEMFYYIKISGDLVYKIPFYFKNASGENQILVYSTSIDTTLDITAKNLDPEEALLSQLKGSGEKYYTEEIVTNSQDIKNINNIISSYQENEKEKQTNVYLDNKLIYKNGYFINEMEK